MRFMSVNSIMRSSYSKGIRDYEFPLGEFQREPFTSESHSWGNLHLFDSFMCLINLARTHLKFLFRSLELLFPLWLSFRENVVNNFLPAPRHPANGTCRASCRLIERLGEHLIIESCFQHHHREYQICFCGDRVLKEKRLGLRLPVNPERKLRCVSRRR